MLENLKVEAMTRSTKGAIDNPGTNVKQESELKRYILKTSWNQLDQLLSINAVR